MQTKTLYSNDISHLEKEVEEFILGKIVLDVLYNCTMNGWRADVLYINIFQEG